MLNKVQLIGRVGKAPELFATKSGETLCVFSVATSERYKDKQGNNVEKTEWHNIKMFGKLAEIARQYLNKGSLVYLEGKIQSQNYTDTQGNKRTAYDIICNEMKMLGGKDDNAQNAQQTPQPPSKQQATPAQPIENLDDDIPF